MSYRMKCISVLPDGSRCDRESGQLLCEVHSFSNKGPAPDNAVTERGLLDTIHPMALRMSRLEDESKRCIRRQADLDERVAVLEKNEVARAGVMSAAEKAANRLELENEKLKVELERARNEAKCEMDQAEKCIAELRAEIEGRKRDMANALDTIEMLTRPGFTMETDAAVKAKWAPDVCKAYKCNNRASEGSRFCDEHRVPKWRSPVVVPTDSKTEFTIDAKDERITVTIERSAKK